jgi:hypothetical protein
MSNKEPRMKIIFDIPLAVSKTNNNNMVTNNNVMTLSGIFMVILFDQKQIQKPIPKKKFDIIHHLLVFDITTVLSLNGGDGGGGVCVNRKQCDVCSIPIASAASSQ